MKIESITHKFGSERITNKDLINQKTSKNLLNRIGIETRYRCSKNENVIDLASQAFQELVGEENCNPDFLIGVTQTSPVFFPHLSAFVQGETLKHHIGSFDINLGCSGFVYTLIVLESMMEKNICKKPVIICADSYNKYLNRSDNSSYLLFSDAAVAISFSNEKSIKILASDLGTDGTGANNLILKKDELNNPEIYMNGPAVMLFTLNKVVKSVKKVLTESNLKIDNIDFFLFHQASKIVLDELRSKLKIDQAKMPSNLRDIGNTVSCTIPLLIKELKSKEELKKGNKILLSGFGVGLSWATCIIEV